MHPPPQVGEAPLGDRSGQDQPAPSARRPRRRALLVAAVLVPVLLAAAVITYLAGGFHDDGRFRAEPAACATLAPSVRLLGPAYVLQQDDRNNCDLLLPPDHPSYVPVPTITVSYYVATPRREDAPEAAAELLRRLTPGTRRLPGVGDEAYLRDRSVFLRVSNLVVGIVVFPRVVSTEEQVLAFAADLADRLRNN
ncbi:hypothetical protein DLJ47_04510 [Micromonospora sp. S4605]|uniref:hypothetical protein n=1 Tax=Micromonospora sp. S4605 TaxID=1420897 RepID=UPI000D6F80FA|nr:hypothetical protein [Micromonospora sp. S4605]PWU56858.1 hypothetical protein DLJ47_04510 [Micromonospora sp. S4605]